jgi:ectoine hydroxylase-related dioxygenase (phytanoyl-CoA dioxygenase family)
MTDVSASHAPLGVKDRVEDWITRFQADGFLVVDSVLPADLITELKADLDAALGASEHAPVVVELAMRMFEQSRANLRLFDRDPIATFAERVIGDDRPAFGADHVHVIHNNSFRTQKTQGISNWHQDEPPYYVVTDGEPPANVRLPVLLFTCNYYLTDVTELDHGPTQFIPGSHLFGAAPPDPIEGTKWEDQVVNAYGKAGTAVLFTCQTWHRGAPNQSDRTRYVTQVSYAHRTIGHRFYPFMNYVLPEQVLKDASPRLRRLLGFVPTGPYG